MSSSSRRTDETPDSRADEDVYDEYSDRLLGGEFVDPDSFLAEHHPDASQDLRSALRKLYSTARGSHGSGRDPDALPFERLGEYRLLKRLGRGGMGVVYLAEQTSLGRRVALKLVRPELADSDVALERFRREARAVARLRHPGIVTVHGAGEASGIAYLAMELVEGASLAERLKRDGYASVPLAQKVRWIAEVARALDYAHGEGVVHRDVKPSNIRLSEDGRALLVDFGLVRSSDTAGATLTDSFAGTPSYASPEQVQGSHEVDARTDVYSLGVTLYQCLTGKVPFEARSVEALFQEILTSQPPLLRHHDDSIPRDLEVVTAKAMEREPERRYASAGAFADDLEAVLALQPILARPPGPLERLRRTARRHRAATATLVTSLVALAVLFGLLVGQQRAQRRADRDDAAALVSRARERIESYHESRVSLESLARQVGQLRQSMVQNYVSPEGYAELDESERELEAAGRVWEATYYEVLELLQRAEDLDPRVAGAADVRAELFLERYGEVVEREGLEAAEVYRDLAIEALDGRELPPVLGEYVRATFVTDPPGAEVHLFRFVEEWTIEAGGEPRMVAIPDDGSPTPAPPGGWALEVGDASEPARRHDQIIELAGHPVEGAVFVREGAGEVAAFDRLRSVDGLTIRDMDDAAPYAPGLGGPPHEFVFERGERTISVSGRGLTAMGITLESPWDLVQARDRAPLPAVAIRYGERVELELPAGLEVRATAMPTFLGPTTLVGRTPLEIDIRRYVAYKVVLALPGHEHLTAALTSPGQALELDTPLFPVGKTPRGFVRIPKWASYRGDFWMMEREVTCGEYLEFLNDFDTLIAIEDASRPILYPRQSGLSGGPLWERDEDGLFELPESWREDWPVVGVSWNDARAYAAWRTERANEEGRQVVFALPNLDERGSAGGGTTWPYVFGRHFRPRWSRSCFAHPIAGPGRVMQFPIDRSPLGVYDLSGSALEWLDGWFDESRGSRHVAGGAWGQAPPDMFRTYASVGADEDATSGETGFRLLMRTVEESAR